MKTGLHKRTVIKIGSNVITGDNGLMDDARIKNLVAQLAGLKNSGHEVILVSSGAVASGRSLVKLEQGKHDMVAQRQVFAAVGQVKLINTYNELFRPYGIQCAQVLVTKEDFRDRLHYLNMRNCFNVLLHNNILPVVNENDVISVTELMFTDNDELAGLIASMVDAGSLIILTNVDGIYNGDPADPGSSVIPVIEQRKVNFSSFISSGKSKFGRGGMLTKSKMAFKIAQNGISVHIANGKKDSVLTDILNDKEIGTRFVPQRNASNLKRWIAHSESYAKASIIVNDGARDALLSDKKASSLLPVGISRVKGNFDKGDLIKVIDEQGNFVALGVAQYNSDKAREVMGKKNQKPIIHYDYLYRNHGNF